jgi:hypothetical protein
MGLLDMREPRRPFAHAMPPPPEQSAGRAHHGGLDIRRRPHPPAEPHGHRVRINRIVLSLPAVNRCHREGMPEHERNPLTSAEVGEPVPGQETLDGHDASGATWCHGPEECFRTGLHVLVEPDPPSLVQETDRPAPGMPTDAAIQVVLFGVKLPGVSSPLVTWCVPVPADHEGTRRRGPPYVSKVCSRRPPASVLTSLPLPAAAEPQRWTDPPGEGTSSERSTSPLTVHPAAPSILLALVRDRHAAISPCRLPDYRKLHSEMQVNS